jgi:hypothetical protein
MPGVDRPRVIHPNDDIRVDRAVGYLEQEIASQHIVDADEATVVFEPTTGRLAALRRMPL